MQPQLLTVIKEEKLKTWTPAEWAQWWVEPKFDGARLIYHKGKFLSRTGKPLYNLEHIAAEIQSYVALEGLTFDGEVYGHDWADTMSAARSSKTARPGNGLRFAIFDVMKESQWEAQACPHNQVARRRTLDALIPQGKSIHAMPRLSCGSYEHFQKLHAANLSMGCDGTVLKRLDSLYEFKRVRTWLKVKPVETFDCKVVGYKEGTGKYEGMLGALEILPEGAKVTSFCSGMTDNQRSAWWFEPDAIAGKTIEVSARGVHPSGRLIEPRFIRIREDK